MPNKNYLRGRRFEWELMKMFEKTGCSVMRTAGSHGVADVVAVTKQGLVHFVQAKVAKTEAEAQRMIKQFKAKPYLPTGLYVQHFIVKVPRKGLYMGTVEVA